MHKNVDEPQKKVEEEEKIKDFPSWIYKNLSKTKLAKELHIERK